MLSSERNKIAPKDYKILTVRYCQCYILNYHNNSSSLPYSQSFVKKNSVPISQVEFYHLHQFKDNGHYTLTVWYIHVGPEIYQVVCAEISIITFLQKQVLIKSKLIQLITGLCIVKARCRSSSSVLSNTLRCNTENLIINTNQHKSIQINTNQRHALSTCLHIINVLSFGIFLSNML